MSAVIIPTEEEAAAVQPFETRVNQEFIDSQEGQAYLKAVKAIFKQVGLEDSPALTDLFDKFHAGVLDKSEFESAFNVLFEEAMLAKEASRRDLAKFYGRLGIVFYEYQAVHALNPKILPDMDLDTQYVEILRDTQSSKRTVVGATILPRKTYPDGTLRMVKQDLYAKFLTPTGRFGQEADLLLKYQDLRHYHEDGDLNVELTVAAHMDYYERSEERHAKKAGVSKPLLPADPLGRNDLCPCKSGKKYKHCHLGALMVGTSIEEAKKHFGKDFFDIKPEVEEISPDGGGLI